MAKWNTNRPLYKFKTSYDEARETVFSRYEYNCALRGVLVRDEGIVRAYTDKAARWLTDASTRPWLFIIGPVGTGKSTLLRAVKNFIGTRGIMHSALDINGYAKEDDPYYYRENILAGTDCPFLLLDDVGQETIEVKSYGNSINPFVEIVTKRYDWQKPLAITSNLSIAEIGNRYGERVADRIREMAEVITIKGNSYR